MVDNRNILICTHCGEEYKTRKDREHLSRYCSKSCWGKSCGGGKGVEDLTGKVFGRWTVVARADNTKQGSTRWHVRCSCGNEAVVQAKFLKDGQSQSCGCLRREVQSQLQTTHGMSRNPKYRTVYGKQYRDRKSSLDRWLPEHQYLLFSIQTACVVCGSVENLAVDHVLPLSKGFGLQPGNAVILCKSCNSSKSDRSLEKLPADWRNKIIKASKEFEAAWQQRL